jgi:hypothetical protein
VRKEILPNMPGVAENVFIGETISFQRTFPDENMRQEDVASFTSGQFSFGALFKPRMFTTLRARVAKPVARQFVVCDPCNM